MAAAALGGLAGLTDWLSVWSLSSCVTAFGRVLQVVSHLGVVGLLVASPLRRRGWKRALALAIVFAIAALLPAIIIGFIGFPFLYDPGHWSFG